MAFDYNWCLKIYTNFTGNEKKCVIFFSATAQIYPEINGRIYSFAVGKKFMYKITSN